MCSMTNKDCTYHFIGIGGIGMSALAKILLDKKMSVSGSDMSTSLLVQNLSLEGAKVYMGHDERNVPDSAIVVYSTDIKEHNPELQKALKNSQPILHRSDLLAKLMNGQKTLAVAGTHGKTTTSALLAYTLYHAGIDPSFAVGGLFQCDSTPNNGRYGLGGYFVAEADESDGTFLKYFSHGAIITNAEPEHLNYYGSADKMYQAFVQFYNQIQDEQHLFWCYDDEGLRTIYQNCKGYTYGFANECNLKLSNFRQEGWKIIYDITFRGQVFTDIEIPLTGSHNALNSAAVFGLCLTLGLSEDQIRAAFKTFAGVARRCEKKGEANEILVLDDYGHHPTEVKKTIAAIRGVIEERRLIVLFQPHRYTRTRDCLEEFAAAFDDADQVFITDLYAAREVPIEGISELSIVEKVVQRNKVECRYLPTNKWLETITPFLRPHDVVVTIGAGTITGFGPKLLDHLKNKSTNKWRVGLIKGGKSCEHDISLKSATFVEDSLDKELYDVKTFTILKDGRWTSDAVLDDAAIFPSAIMEELEKCDILFPILHGPLGEDGTIQGFFELLGKAYVGPDFRSAAICMDKALTKKIALFYGIPTLRFIEMGAIEWKQDRQKCLKKLTALQFPLFIKPLHLGSTIGVRKAESHPELIAAIENAFSYDTMLLVETALENPREIELAVRGNHSAEGYRIEMPIPGEICSQGKIYDYEAKYGAQAAGTSIPADLTEQQIKTVQDYAKKIYQAVGLNCLARVDFFLDRQGNFWLNEINPIPGFTKNSLYPKVWDYMGSGGKKLINRLVILALHRRRISNRLLTI